MGAKKQWTGKEKLAIVLQGLKGDCSVSALCNDYSITQGMYYKWRDQLLSDGAKLFERGGVDHARERLEHENRKLKETRSKIICWFRKTVSSRHSAKQLRTNRGRLSRTGIGAST